MRWCTLLFFALCQSQPPEPSVGLLAPQIADHSARRTPDGIFRVPDHPDPAAEIYVDFSPDDIGAAEGKAEGNEYRNDDDPFGVEDLLDDEYDLAGISCALISGECSACAKTRGCGYCASAGVCMDSRGPCASARPITWHWQCSDHTRWWVIVLVSICMLASCAIVTGCCLKLLCCCCLQQIGAGVSALLCCRWWRRRTHNYDDDDSDYTDDSFTF